MLVITVMHQSAPTRNEVMPDTPLRLSVAAALAFPDSTMTEYGDARRDAR